MEKPFRCYVGRRESRPRFRDPLNLGLDSLWPFGRLEITTGRPYKALKGLEGLSLALKKRPFQGLWNGFNRRLKAF